MQPATEKTAPGTREFVLLLMLLLGTIGAVVHLFAERFATGDMYPAYSSLRSDPKGLKVLAESLTEAGFTVKRNYEDLKKWSFPADSTLLVAGLPDLAIPGLVDDEELQQLLDLLEDGGRVVLAMTGLPPQAEIVDPEIPETGEEETGEQEEKKTDKGSSGTQEEEEGGDDQEEKDFSRQLGFKTATVVQLDKGDTDFRATAFSSTKDAAFTLPWYSAAYFTDLDPAWQEMLRVHGLPVMIRRPWATGTLILATDCRFLSNEALWKERSAPLLTKLFPQPGPVVFDEAHHGIRRRISITRLILDFDLHGVLAGLTILALLFVWRSSSPVLPPPPGQTKPLFRDNGRDQFSGLVNIISSHASSNPVQVCVRCWQKSNRTWCRSHPEKAQSMLEIADKAEAKDQVTAYSTIIRLLHERQWSSSHEQQRNTHE